MMIYEHHILRQWYSPKRTPQAVTRVQQPPTPLLAKHKHTVRVQRMGLRWFQRQYLIDGEIKERIDFCTYADAIL